MHCVGKGEKRACGVDQRERGRGEGNGREGHGKRVIEDKGSYGVRWKDKNIDGERLLVIF